MKERDEHRRDDPDDAAVVAAFTRLRRDAGGVSAEDALQRIRPSRPAIRWGALVAGAIALLVVAGLVAVLAGGSEDADVVASDPDGDDVGEESDGLGEAVLEGTVWQLVRGGGPGGEIELVDGWPITLTFEQNSNGDAVFGGTAACNGYGGWYEVDPNGSLLLTDLAVNAARCAGDDVMAAETTFLDALGLVDRLDRREGLLVLAGPDAELVFAPEPLAPVDLIAGRTWRLVGLVQDNDESAAAGAPATLRLDRDGTVSGGTGCRLLSGEWIQAGASIQFPSFGADGECTPDLAEQDGRVVSVLGDGFTAEVDGDVLRLTSAGDERLIYRLTEDEVTSSTLPVPDPEVEEAMTVTALMDERPETWVEVVGHLHDRGGGHYLCDAEIVDGSCRGRFVVLAGEALEPALLESSLVVRGTLDEWGRFVVDPAGELGEPGPERFESAATTPEEDEIVDALLAGDLENPVLRWAPGGVVVSLGGVAAQRVVEPDRIADPASWELDPEFFRGRDGPFSVLSVLAADADPLLGREVAVFIGTHAHCAAPPMPLPEVVFSRQLVIQPTGIDSCLQWFVVDVLLDGEDRIVAVNLDLWEP